jgi:hypothetical protein
LGDDRRVYSDEEFALILRKAAELAEPPDPTSHSQSGLTLAEMKAAASQVGIDPALVERAARLLTASDSAAPSFMERVIGGRARHSSRAEFPIVLDEARAAQLLSAIRISVGRTGDGHSSALGLTWRSSDDGGSVLSLTAQTDQEGTSVQADLDRRGTLVAVASLTGVGCFMATLFGGTVAGELFPGLEPAGALFGLAAVLAVGRAYWRSSSRRARDRLSRVIDAVSQFLTRSGDPSARPGPTATGRTEREHPKDAT